MSGSVPKQPNLMQADQARKKAMLEKKRRKLSPIVLIIPGILLFFAFLAFVVYLVLDMQFEQRKERELNKAIEDFKNQPVPTPTVTEGRKFYFIWQCELYEYDIDTEKSTLISAEVEGYKDIPCLQETLFTEPQTILPAYDDGGLVIGIYMFDFTSADVLTKLEISPGRGENTFAFSSAGRIAYQFILNDAIYSINVDTKEADKLFAAGGFSPLILPVDGDFLLELSPDRKAILIEDTISQATDPFEEGTSGQEYFSVRIIGLDGKVIDSFQGKHAHWLDDSRVVYWPYKNDGPNLTIRNTKTKTRVEILQSLEGVIATDVDTKNSLIFISTRKDDESGNFTIESYFYDNSTGVETKLSKGYLDITYLMDNLVVGFNPGKGDVNQSIELAGIGILNLDKNEGKLIIGE